MGTRKIFLAKSYEAAQAIARGFKVGEDGVTCVGRGTVIGSGKQLLPPQYVERGGCYVEVHTEAASGGAPAYTLIEC